MEKTILITGSGGFIGRNLKKYLKNKYKLLTPRSYELDLTNSVAVQNYFVKNKIDFIIHCGSVGGARGIQDKETTVEDNLAMVKNLLSSKRENVKMILFGSGAMYDKSRSLHRVKESEIGKVIPMDLYGKSKVEIFNLVKNKKDVLMLNIFACYGYGEKENRFPSYAINQVLKNEDIIINQNCIFDYLFVEDMQKIVEHFIEQDFVDNVINITPKLSISLENIAKIVQKFSDKNIQIKIKIPELNNEYTGDNSLLLKNYPELEFTEIEHGLKKLFEYKKERAKNE